MAATSNLRTVWLTLRATNYTTAVLTSVMRQMDGMMTAQRNMALTQMEMGKSALMAGTMFTVLGSQIGGTGGKLLSMTGQFMMIAGLMNMVTGIMSALSKANMEQQVTVLGLTMSYRTLAISMGAAFASFMIAYELLQGMPKWATAVIAVVLGIAAAFWALYVAESAASFGIAAVMGGAAAAAAMVTAGGFMGGAPHYQMGTRMVPFTGLGMLHRGEVVYNPATNRPSGIMTEGGAGKTTVIDATMHVDTINTKMDKEEMSEYVRKQSRTIAQNNR